MVSRHVGEKAASPRQTGIKDGSDAVAREPRDKGPRRSALRRPELPVADDCFQTLHRTVLLLVCLRGGVEVTAWVAGRPVVTALSPGEPGLLIGNGIASTQRYLRPDSMLLVFASRPYDRDDYFSLDESTED